MNNAQVEELLAILWFILAAVIGSGFWMGMALFLGICGIACVAIESYKINRENSFE